MVSSGSYYSWGADGMPVSIRTGAEAIDRINRAIALAPQGDAGRGMEIGGILLGRVERAQDGPATVIVEDIELVESQHRRGLSYVLSERDRKALAGKLRARTRIADGLAPVGFFRSHTRRGLYLDNDDFSLIRTYFPEPHAVFLLVRPVKGAANVAGFFFWEEGDIRRNASYQEFAFGSPVTAEDAVVSERASAGWPPAWREWAWREWAWREWARRAVAALGAIRVPAVNWRLAGPIAAALALVASIYEGNAVRSERTPRREAARTATRRTAHTSPPLAAIVPDIKPSPLGAIGGVSRRGSASRSMPPLSIPESAAPPAGEPPALPPPPALDNAASPGVPPPVVGGTMTATIPAKYEPPPERPLKPALAMVRVETAPESKVKRLASKLPGLHRLERQRAGYVPARPIREFAPVVPAHLTGAVPVDVRVTVNKSGRVSSVEISGAADRHLMKLAADAAQRWQFQPARVNDEIVTSDMIIHFTFRRTKAEP